MGSHQKIAVVNTPGIPFENLTHEQWKSLMDTSLMGMFLCAQEAFRMMKSQKPRGATQLDAAKAVDITPEMEYAASCAP